MVKEKVLSGRYKDCAIVYDHISYNSEDIYFNNFTVMNMEPADMSKVDYWNDKSLRVDGSFMSGEADKDRRLISVKWRNGEQSVLQVNTKTYNRLMEAVFSEVPQEKTSVKRPAKRKKKSSNKGIIFIAIIVIAIVIKFIFFN